MRALGGWLCIQVYLHRSCFERMHARTLRGQTTACKAAKACLGAHGINLLHHVDPQVIAVATDGGNDRDVQAAGQAAAGAKASGVLLASKAALMVAAAAVGVQGRHATPRPAPPRPAPLCHNPKACSGGPIAKSKLLQAFFS